MNEKESQMTQAEQQGEQQQHDVEEAFEECYVDWTGHRTVALASEEHWALLAWACGCTSLYKQLKGEK